MSRRIEALRTIVADRQCAKVDGVLFDVLTAQSVLACYDAGSDRTKRVIENADPVKVATIALRMTRS